MWILILIVGVSICSGWILILIVGGSVCSGGILILIVGGSICLGDTDSRNGWQYMLGGY